MPLRLIPLNKDHEISAVVISNMFALQARMPFPDIGLVYDYKLVEGLERQADDDDNDEDTIKEVKACVG